MEFFISNAYAQGAAEPSPFSPLLFMAFIFIAFYFFIIRPQQKKQKQHAATVAAVKVGDEIMTAGGILGRVTGVSDHYAIVHVADNTEIKIQKSSISAVVPKGTFDEA